jgi:tetratricopeptide (TPR) repeat protein
MLARTFKQAVEAARKDDRPGAAKLLKAAVGRESPFWTVGVCAPEASKPAIFRSLALLQDVVEPWEHNQPGRFDLAGVISELAAFYGGLNRHSEAKAFYQIWLELNPESADAKAGLERMQATDEASKAKLIKWVEDFFRHNYRDITARRTLEWGEVQKEPSGNLSIRYKYLATIWDKDKLVIEEQYTFTPDGKFVSVKSLSKVPAAPAPANRPAGLPENASAQLIGTWRELLNPRDLIFRPDRTFELLQMDRPKPGLLLAGTWELDGRLLTRKITQSPENAARAGQEERQEIWVLSPGFLELRTPGGPGPLWQYERLPVNDKAIAPAN